MPPNNSFKPKLLRSGNGVAEKACHAVACATQFGLTQALDLLLNYLVPIVLCICCALASGWYGLRSFNKSDESCRDLFYSALTGLGLAVGLFSLFGFWSLLDGANVISYLFPDMPVRRGQRGIYLVYMLGSYGIGTMASAVFLRLTGRCSQV